MLGESVALALVFGVVVGLLTARLLGTLHMLALAPMQQLDTPTKLMVSLGAGLYEELLFRVILVSGLATFGRVVCGMTPRVAGAFAVVLGAVIFSAFHYVGAYGDVFTMQSFTFRMIAGLFFSALYLLRGLRHRGVDARAVRCLSDFRVTASKEILVRRILLALARARSAAARSPPQREAVLKQINVPHPYYFREMYLPQLTTGPSGAAWMPDGACARVLNARIALAADARHHRRRRSSRRAAATTTSRTSRPTATGWRSTATTATRWSSSCSISRPGRSRRSRAITR